MVLYPESQKRAQEERDTVLGHGHLPEDALPYLKVVRYELMRPNRLERPIISFAICSRVLIPCVPHRLTENDICNGYFIPAGCWSSPTRGKPKSSLLPVPLTPTPQHTFRSLRAILHDHATYLEPSKFKPKRLLDPASRAPFPEAAFGYGRCKCRAALAWDAV